MCHILNVPLSKDKTKGPSQIMDFLGFELNSLSETILLPKVKVEKGLLLLSSFLSKKKCKLSELQSLLGFLNFACAVIIPGRAFLQRLYGATVGVAKPYFYIRLNQELKKDLQLWFHFFQFHNGITFYRHQLFLSPEVIHVYSDAAKSLGYAAILDSHWFYAAWPSAWWSEQNIVLLELVPIVLALEVWGHLLRDKVVVFHTDNLALVSVINNQKSKEPLVMLLVRSFVFNQLLHNVSLKAVHVPGYLNVNADMLSRLQVQRFMEANRGADTIPAKLPRLPERLRCMTEFWSWPEAPCLQRLRDTMTPLLKN